VSVSDAMLTTVSSSFDIYTLQINYNKLWPWFHQLLINPQPPPTPFILIGKENNNIHFQYIKSHYSFSKLQTTQQARNQASRQAQKSKQI
jgi:hypothetical protein